MLRAFAAKPIGLRAVSTRRLLKKTRSLNTESKDAPDVVSAVPVAPIEVEDRTQYLGIASLASVGAVETAYLAATKYLNLEVACPTDGCENVLSSPYAFFLGQPLSLYGLLTYGSVAALAFTLNASKGQGRSEPSEASTSGRPPSGESNESASASPSGGLPRETLRWALVGGSTLLLSCSGYLMYVLFTQLGGEWCTYCFGSAALSSLIFALALPALPKKSLETAGPLIAGVAASAILALTTAHKDAGASIITVIPFQKPIVETVSPPGAADLARRLKEAGAKMYGAFWCSHCFEQKEYFGAEAMASFPYVECYPDGWTRGVELAPACSAAGVKGFPTWEINGKTYEGEKTFDELEKLLKEDDV